MPVRAVKRPVEIEAVKFTCEEAEIIKEWTYNSEDDTYKFNWGFERCDAGIVQSLWGQVYDVLHDTWINVYPGQWIIKGVQGEFYPCDSDVFDSTYEVIDD